jgi:hypothetical protein
MAIEGMDALEHDEVPSSLSFSAIEKAWRLASLTVDGAEKIELRGVGLRVDVTPAGANRARTLLDRRLRSKASSRPSPLTRGATCSTSTMRISSAVSIMSAVCESSAPAFALKTSKATGAASALRAVIDVLDAVDLEEPDESTPTNGDLTGCGAVVDVRWAA